MAMPVCLESSAWRQVPFGSANHMSMLLFCSAVKLPESIFFWIGMKRHQSIARFARLLVCSFACLLAWLFACLLSFSLLAFFLACLLGSSKFVPWRLLDSSSRCSGARDSVLGGCLRAPRGVRELETRSLEAAGELLEVFGSSKFGPWSLLESSLRCSGAPQDRPGRSWRVCWRA